MRFWAYCWTSTALFTTMIAETLLVYPNYFSALVGVADSAVKACIVINFACMLTVIWSKLVVSVFLRDLNNGELQTIYQRGWLFLCNSLLYWGTFNSKVYVNPYNLGVCMISVLVIMILHCVCRSRVRGLQALDTSNVTYGFIFKVFKLAVLCFTLLTIDIVVCAVAMQRFHERDFTLTLFAFFLIDLVEMATVFCGELIVNAFSIHYLYHHEDEDEWEKSALLTQIIRMSSSVFAMVAHVRLVYIFGLWYSDSWSFIGRAFRFFRNATGLYKVLAAESDLDKFTLSPSAEELQRDNTCVICRDEMLLADEGNRRKAAKKLRCGHVMHTGCLSSWIKRSASCPTCRQPVHSAASSFRQATAGSPNNAPDEASHASTREQSPSAEAHHQIGGSGVSDTRTTMSRRELNIMLSVAHELAREEPGTASQQPQPEPTRTLPLESPSEPPSSAPSTSDTERSQQPEKPMGPITVQMTNDNSGILAGRYRFSFEDVK